MGDRVGAEAGASRPGLGYVPVLAETLQSARSCGKGQALGCRLELVDLSEAGATTVTLIERQLPDATARLRERNSNATRWTTSG